MSSLRCGVVERGDQRVLVPVPVVEHRRDDAARLELSIKADAVEQFERGGMIGAGARHLIEEIVVAERLDEADRDVLPAPAPATGTARPGRRR